MPRSSGASAHTVEDLRLARRAAVAHLPLAAAPPDLRHLAEVGIGATSAARTAPKTRLVRRGLAHSSARSLLFTVLGEYVLPMRAPVPTRALLAALGVFETDEMTARQAIARTAAAGWLTGRRAGRSVSWELTPSARDLLERGADRIYHFGAVGTAWDGRWLMLRLNVSEDHRDLRQKLRTQLAWASFGALRQGLWITPHVDREAEAVRILENLGLHGDATSFVVHVGRLGDETALVREAWDLPMLAGEYAEFLAEFENIPRLRADEAFAALTRMVHEWRRFPFRDPGLPAALLPRDWAGHRARNVFARRRSTWGPVAARWFSQQAGFTPGS